jgi:ribose/xylose/arabinose/galactoside ABC-type transport system permease subunit
MESSPVSASSLANWLSGLRQRQEFGLLLAIVVVLVLTALLDQNHDYWKNPRESAIDILRHTSMLGIFTLGAAIVIISGGIDLSAGSVIAFSGTLCLTLLALLAPEQMSLARPFGLGVMILAVLGTLLAGFLIGSLHAWLITVVGLPPFVATLATLVGLRSFARAIVRNVTAHILGGEKTQIDIADVRFRYLSTSLWIPVVLFAILAWAAWLLMSRTVLGRHLHALGGNEQATRLSGIKTERLKWFAYCASAVLSSIAGILYTCDQAVADPQNLGIGYELNAIAAAVVGGCSLMGGVGTIPGTILGALFLRTVIAGVARIIKTGADVYEGLIVGGVVVIAVAFTQFRETARRGKRFFPGALGLVTIANLVLVSGTLAMLLAEKIGLNIRGVGLSAALSVLVLLVLARLYEGRERTPVQDKDKP